MNKIASQLLKLKPNFKPTIGIILGSGWNEALNLIEDKMVINYSDIEGMPVCSVPGHNGTWVLGKCYGKEIIAMQGRFHLYEGYTSQEITLPIIAMKELGIKTLIITNAAGGINNLYKAGDLVVLNDHINMTGTNALIKKPGNNEHPQFIDMSRIYDKDLIKTCEDVCKNFKYTLHKGVYIQVVGPIYETPAEIKMYRTLGADLVGMSTVQEAIVATSKNIKILGISCVSNMASGITKEPICHQEVIEIAHKNKDKLGNLIIQLIKNIN